MFENIFHSMRYSFISGVISSSQYGVMYAIRRFPDESSFEGNGRDVSNCRFMADYLWVWMLFKFISGSQT